MTARIAQPATAARRPRSNVLGRIRREHRRFVVSAAVLAVGLLFSGCNSNATEPTAPKVAVPEELVDDVAGVTAVVTAWDAAWNAGDATALAGLFVQDAEFINGRGQIAQGPAAIRAQHAGSFATNFKGSHSAGSIRRIAFLSATSALVDVDNELTGFVSMPPGVTPTEPGVNRGRHKRLVVKTGGRWQIQLMQITLIAPKL
jgi:uncharacterized protein (TIGR02246 family)